MMIYVVLLPGFAVVLLGSGVVLLAAKLRRRWMEILLATLGTLIIGVGIVAFFFGLGFLAMSRD